MAFVVRFDKDDKDFRSFHPTKVIYGSLVGESDERKLLQPDTRGSDGREMPDRPSHTLQLDQGAARQPLALLSKEF